MGFLFGVLFEIKNSLEIFYIQISDATHVI